MIGQHHNASTESGKRRPDDVEMPSPFVPFPVEALPQLLRDFVESGAVAIGCDTSYLALPLLSAIGAAIGNSRRLHVKNSWQVPAVIWTAVIGESGTAKSPAFKLAIKHLRDRQSQLVAAYREEKKGFLEASVRYDEDLSDWKKNRKKSPGEEVPATVEEPTCKRIVTQDTTIEGLIKILKDNPKGMLVERDELAGWFGSFDKYSKGQSDSAHWLSMFNADSILVDRASTDFVCVPKAFVCVTGGIQPGILSRVLTSENKESGLAARILMALPPRLPKKWTEADLDSSTEESVKQLFAELFDLMPLYNADGDPVPKVIGMSKEAKRVWIDYYDSHNVEQLNTTGDIAAAYSKLEEYPLRFALIFHLVGLATGSTNDSQVSLASVESGIRLANWFKNEAKRVYAIMSFAGEDAAARDLHNWIVQKGGRVTARHIQQGRRKIKNATAAEDALNLLVKFGFGRWEGQSTGGRGRPTRYFVSETVYPSTVYDNTSNTVENGNSVDCRPVDVVQDQGDVEDDDEIVEVQF